MDERDVEGRRSGWVYSDNVNSPEIREWLYKVVGAESEDLSRHDKWLCMMYPRLVLLHQFLRDDGVIFISIDEIEIASLRFLLDEIFGPTNRVGTIVWSNATDNNPTNIAVEHEYILCYARNKRVLPSEWKSSTIAMKEQLLEVEADFIRRYPDREQRQTAYTRWYRENRSQIWPFQDYKFIDDGGIYTGSRSVHNPGKEGYRYDVLHPVTGRPCLQPMMGYRFPQETMVDLLAQDRILFGSDESKIIELKVYVKDYRAKLSSLFELDGRVGTNELKQIFPENKRPFDFPKPTGLIEELLSFTTTGNDLVLDSFAGSGTTGHAVLKLNRADGQNRRFALIEMKHAIATEIASERIRRIITGISDDNAEPGLGGGFHYCTLGPTLFDAAGQIRTEVSFADLARFVFFAETGRPLRPSAAPSPLLGVADGRAVYLLYNGVLKDRTPAGGNVLTRAVLRSLPAPDDGVGQRVVYAAACLLSPAHLRQANALFRQIPYELRIG